MRRCLPSVGYSLAPGLHLSLDVLWNSGKCLASRTDYAFLRSDCYKGSAPCIHLRTISIIAQPRTAHSPFRGRHRDRYRPSAIRPTQCQSNHPMEPPNQYAPRTVSNLRSQSHCWNMRRKLCSASSWTVRLTHRTT